MPIINDDGEVSFIEFNEEGVPLGEWKWCDDEESWVFDIFDGEVPLAFMELLMPATGEPMLRQFIMLALAAALIIAGTVLHLRRKKVT